jgi:hypothetical protein
MDSRCKYCTHSTQLSESHEIYKCDVTVEVVDNVMECDNYDGYYEPSIYELFNEKKNGKN